MHKKESFQQFGGNNGKVEKETPKEKPKEKPRTGFKKKLSVLKTLRQDQPSDEV